MGFQRDILLALVLIFVGILISVVSYFVIHLISLVAFGLSILIIGLTIVSLPKQVTGSDSMKALLQGAILGISPLLEEINSKRGGSEESKAEANPPVHHSSIRIKSKCVYLPPKLLESENGGTAAFERRTAFVYVPLDEDSIDSRSEEEMRNAPTKLLCGEPQKGIRIFTIGSDLMQVPELGQANLSVEDALKHILVDSAELCSSVRASEIEDTVIVEIHDVKVQPETQVYRELLGSLPTSLAASAVSTIRRKQVVIDDERITPSKTIVRFTLHS
jgi:hypothetical protein